MKIHKKTDVIDFILITTLIKYKDFIEINLSYKD